MQEIRSLNAANSDNTFQNPSQYKAAQAQAQALAQAAQAAHKAHVIQPKNNSVPRGCNSLSMRMLNAGLDEGLNLIIKFIIKFFFLLNLLNLQNFISQNNIFSSRN